jgi:D-lactate dehydrogenase
VPQWSADLPGGGGRAGSAPVPGSEGTTVWSSTRSEAPEVVYFSSCTGTMFGPAAPGPGVRSAFGLLCERAGVRLVRPPATADLCCATPWRSKGMLEGARVMEARVVDALWRATRGGLLEVVSDAASCTEGLRQSLEHHPPPGGPGSVRVVDAVQFAADHLLDALWDRRPVGSVVLHPELTASATRAEAAEVAGVSADAYASCNRTCELGMTRATGQSYQHILELLEQTTRP